MPVNDGPEDAYYQAGLNDEEVAALVQLAADAGGADPTRPYVAVRAADLGRLLTVVDRLADQAASR